MKIPDFWTEEFRTISARADKYKALAEELAEALDYYAGWWGEHQGSPIKAVNRFAQNKLNEKGELAREALANYRKQLGEEK